jgi:hypothetical protein
MKTTAQEESWTRLKEGKWRKVKKCPEVPSQPDTEGLASSTSDGKILTSARYNVTRKENHAISPRSQGCMITN